MSLSGPTDACPKGSGPPKVVLSWDNGPRSHPIQSDKSGRFQAHATIPPDAPMGPHTITVECADTHTVTQTVPVVVAQSLPPNPPKPNNLPWILPGALAAAAVAAFALRRFRRRPGPPAHVTAEVSGQGIAEVGLTERDGGAGSGRSVRLEPHPDPGRQSIEELHDDDRRDG
ncbi:hypothetical protein KV557_06005 [Kitasatospora aureofaciens]|uniref:hypothetical protein n=1 Tax=Kitasatospora aureofaciens TaxID=1894 RepID=UPI001C47F1EA|nr:hypothetical protein [Kitasatospora aureofaciens]MBV6696677.1 hypothetical protein [Kitasatospora aureofaciens]